MRWKVWVDTGGTFTDCLAQSPEGGLRRAKVLSSSCVRGKAIAALDKNQLTVSTGVDAALDIFRGYKLQFIGRSTEIYRVTSYHPGSKMMTLDSHIPSSINLPCDIELFSGEEAPILAARLATETPLDQLLPPMEMRLGTTKGTNALLERKGAKTAWFVTRGFKDLIEIGTQQRPDIFALKIEKPLPLYSRVIEVDERVDHSGKVVVPLNIPHLRKEIQKLKEEGIDSVAISLLNSFRNDCHERLVEQTLIDHGISSISVSSSLSSGIKLLPRAETAVVNAYLSPLLSGYLQGVKEKLSGSTFKIMTSAGSLASEREFRPKDSLLSGPAGGVVGAAEIARLCGEKQVLTLDMGGTSTDVSRYSGHPDYRYECQVGSARIASPSVAIETVAAGGGSICQFDGFKFTVGPESAGASPGPACYGAGGPLTVTDVNLLLGRLDEKRFGIPVNPGAAGRKFEEQLSQSNSSLQTPSDILEGYLQIANERMAEAIRNISVKKGYDPGSHSLLAFGGAGGQHACAIAELLGMEKIIVPYDAGLLSAYGIGQALEERLVSRQVLRPLRELEAELLKLVAAAQAEAIAALQSSGISAEETELSWAAVYMRFTGQDAVVEVESVDYEKLSSLFREKYEALFGHWVEKKTIEVESVKVKVSAKGRNQKSEQKNWPVSRPDAPRTKAVSYNGSVLTAGLFEWDHLTPGASFDGPALVASSTSTIWIAPGWVANFTEDLNAILRKTGTTGNAAKELHDGVALELFTNRFRGIADEMGALLMRTAFSVNIKERLDFSCALLDPQGELVVNAPHIPVHLGSLGLCVREVLKVLPLAPGDVAVTNHPAFGGSHLPDVTLISPVYRRGKLLGYLANRAHHSEIGGMRPGSMPPDARNLAEEGVVINPMLLVKGGQAKWKEIEKVLITHRFPTRSLAENLADLNAALSSIKAGEKALLALCEKEGDDTVIFFMDRLKEYAHQKLWEGLAGLNGSFFEAEEKLDDGNLIRVKISKAKQKLVVDFSGSAGTHPGNLNATPAIVRSAVIYVLRLLITEDIPLNEGIMQKVEVVVPEGMLNPSFSADAEKCPAVVGGNTEVSQRVVDTLIKALKLSACSQGTMNNLLFGNETFGYYETICGGTGAGPGFHGADAIHHHMTNTRMTDPEIMEWRYPVRVEEFSVRMGSGGAGKWNGGNGVIRKLRFTEPVKLTLLTQHRVEEPYGMEGGANGKRGRQYIEKGSGETIDLKGIDAIDLNAGDAVVIQTPGGGGWGNFGGI